MIYALSRGPYHRVTVINRCSINGFFFRTSELEKNFTTQNSGVLVKGGDGMEWYGVVKKMFILDFPNAQEVTIFKCDWFDVPAANKNSSRWYNKDKFGIIDIDTSRFLRRVADPYILAIQAEQVCYVKSGKKPKWCSVLTMKPRTLFAMPEGEDTENYDVATDVDSVITGVENVSIEATHGDLTNWSRSDVEGLSGDATVLPQPMPEPDHDDIPSEDEGDETYTEDGVVAPLAEPEADDDDFFV